MHRYQSLAFSAGDIIIREGDEANLVYTLKQGHAAAYQDGVKVGEILPGEIFGALAAFCNTPRNATVRASTLCRVEALGKEHFTDLAREQPELCVKLIQDMARLIGDLNESIRLLSHAGATD